ncbi:MAG: type I-B CRISPR-associated protein Cas7/Csh2 [Candidatus Heimdallarchaeaceae archaeon]
MSKPIKNRSEILFLYDVKWANPNGDPLDENKPRIDPATGINIVTDVRLKRTIRDYLHEFKGKEIFVREIEYEPGKIQDAKMRAEDFLVDNNGKKLDKSKLTLQEMKKLLYINITKECIDIRLFGATIPIEKSSKEKSSITLIGPVQFRFGRSLHPVEVVHIKGTGAFASGAGKEQKTFREEYVVPYSLICFYGVVNENAAKYTNLTEDDVKMMLEAMWYGTKNLITRSKFGQMPRFLLRIVYKEQNYHIGDLDRKIKLITKEGIEGAEIRDVSDFVIDITELINTLNENREKIEKIEYEVDNNLKLKAKGKEFLGKDLQQHLKINESTEIERLGYY